MSVKFSIKVAGRSFDVTVEDSAFMSDCINELVSLEKDIQIKDLLHAYIKKCFECYRLKEEILLLVKKLEQLD